MKAWLSLIVIVFLSIGCAVKPPVIKYEVVEVKVPIQVKAQAPAELMVDLNIIPPVFIEPSNPKASSALSPEGEKNLKRLLIDYHDRELAWRTWAGAK